MELVLSVAITFFIGVILYQLIKTQRALHEIKYDGSYFISERFKNYYPVFVKSESGNMFIGTYDHSFFKAGKEVHVVTHNLFEIRTTVSDEDIKTTQEMKDVISKLHKRTFDLNAIAKWVETEAKEEYKLLLHEAVSAFYEKRSCWERFAEENAILLDSLE